MCIGSPGDLQGAHSISSRVKSNTCLGGNYSRLGRETPGGVEGPTSTAQAGLGTGSVPTNQTRKMDTSRGLGHLENSTASTQGAVNPEWGTSPGPLQTPKRSRPERIRSRPE